MIYNKTVGGDCHRTDKHLKKIKFLVTFIVTLLVTFYFITLALVKYHEAIYSKVVCANHHLQTNTHQTNLV